MGDLEQESEKKQSFYLERKNNKINFY